MIATSATQVALMPDMYWGGKSAISHFALVVPHGWVEVISFYRDIMRVGSIVVTTLMVLVVSSPIITTSAQGIGDSVIINEIYVSPNSEEYGGIDWNGDGEIGRFSNQEKREEIRQVRGNVNYGNCYWHDPITFHAWNFQKMGFRVIDRRRRVKKLITSLTYSPFCSLWAILNYYSNFSELVPDSVRFNPIF